MDLRRPAPLWIPPLLWATWLFGVRPPWTAALLALAILVIVPLGLAIADRDDQGPRSPAMHLLRVNHLPVATLAVLTFAADPGVTAAALTGPWLVFAIGAATAGIGRLLSRARVVEPGFGIDLALMFLSIGAAWLSVSRAGLQPLGFSSEIVELTAVHFHYAGFALPIAAGMAASMLRCRALVPGLVVVGVPLTAAGITVGGSLETAAATVMAAGGMGTAILLGKLGIDRLGAARVLLVLASGALLSGMTLALVWAWGRELEQEWISIDAMARTHGSLNGIGFGLLGLIGLTVIPNGHERTTRAVGVHLGRCPTNTLAGLHQVARFAEPTSLPTIAAPSVSDDYERFVVTRPLDCSDFDAARSAVRSWAAQHAAGIRLEPPTPPIEVGQTVALAGPLGPLSFSATCRITEVIDEDTRFGFVYTTLNHHHEDGSELFLVELGADGSINATIAAAWRPSTVATRMSLPLTRFVQRRYTTRYLDGIADASGRWRFSCPPSQHPGGGYARPVRLKTRGELRRVDLSPIAELVPALRDEWAQLEFDQDGTLVNPLTGQSVPALVLVSGGHRQAGAVYRITVTSPRMDLPDDRRAEFDTELREMPNTATQEDWADHFARRRAASVQVGIDEAHFAATLQDDGLRRLAFTVSGDDGDDRWTVDVDVEHGRWPRIELGGRVDITASLKAAHVPGCLAGLMGGTGAGTATVDFATIERTGRAVEFTGRANRFRGQGHLDVDASARRWKIAGRAGTRARGLGRPLLWFFGRRVRRTVKQEMATFWASGAERMADLELTVADLRAAIENEGGPAPFVHRALWDDDFDPGLGVRFH